MTVCCIEATTGVHSYLAPCPPPPPSIVFWLLVVAVVATQETDDNDEVAVTGAEMGAVVGEVEVSEEDVTTIQLAELVEEEQGEAVSFSTWN